MLLLCLAMPDTLLGCTACYGASDSPLAQGMNWGILTLLGFITAVLGGVVLFFVHVARRASTQDAAADPGSTTGNH
jgi:hypothetical protein